MGTTGGQSNAGITTDHASPAGGHTAAVGPQPSDTADLAHGLHPHPMQP
jgi:hypothetical protein